MAKNKKSFLLYCDIISMVSKLPDEKAGKLFKHILEYVNDNNPADPEDLLISVAFDPIKQQLKRNLESYNRVIDRNRENGKKGGRPRTKGIEGNPNNPVGLSGNPNKPKKADNVNALVNDNVNDKEELKRKNNKKKFELPENIDQKLWDEWMKVRIAKRAVNSDTAKGALLKKLAACAESGTTENDAIIIAIENSWKSIQPDWLQNIKPGTTNSAVQKAVRKPTDDFYPENIIDGEFKRIQA